MVELITGDIPFAHLSMREVEVQLLKGKICLANTLPQDLGVAWHPLLEEIATFVQEDPKQRPTATQAIARLLVKYPELKQYVVVCDKEGKEYVLI